LQRGPRPLAIDLHTFGRKTSSHTRPSRNGGTRRRGRSPSANCAGTPWMPAKPQKAKALLRYLIAELKVSSRAKSQPTYRVITGTVAQCPKSGRNQTTRHCANHLSLVAPMLAV
jgi:hypothetical protein